MTIEEIRKGAPDNTATHYLVDDYGNTLYIKHENDWQSYWCEHDLYWCRSDTFYGDKYLNKIY